MTLLLLMTTMIMVPRTTMTMTSVLPFQSIGFPLSCVPPALEALDVDSQGGIFSRNRDSFRELPTQAMRDLEEIFLELEVPLRTDSSLEEFRDLIRKKGDK